MNQPNKLTVENGENVEPIPVNLISGSLGVGKTTTINYILEHRPEGEKWAVLVNEYGLVGLDAALIESPNTDDTSDDIQVREVAGGCICCSAGLMFEVSLAVLLEKRPDRLLIEPTGLAAVSGILDTLDRPGFREKVDIRSILCLLDPTQLDDLSMRPEVADQIESSDILLASRADLASAEELSSFRSWGEAIFPPKRFIGTVHKGEISMDLLDLVSSRKSAAPRGSHKHGTDHHTDHVHGHEHDHSEHAHDHHHDHVHEQAHQHSKNTSKSSHDESAAQTDVCDASRPIIEKSHRSTDTSSIGWICWDGLEFDSKRLWCWLNVLSQLPGARRTKAVMRTNEGWWAFNFADKAQLVRPSGYRRDSRLELLIDGNDHPNLNELKTALLSCLTSIPQELALSSN